MWSALLAHGGHNEAGGHHGTLYGGRLTLHVSAHGRPTPPHARLLHVIRPIAALRHRRHCLHSSYIDRHYQPLPSHQRSVGLHRPPPSARRPTRAKTFRTGLVFRLKRNENFTEIREKRNGRRNQTKFVRFVVRFVVNTGPSLLVSFLVSFRFVSFFVVKYYCSASLLKLTAKLL